jgi:hypothetical protein
MAVLGRDVCLARIRQQCQPVLRWGQRPCLCLSWFYLIS